MIKKSSPLKLRGQMEPNLAGSIYVRSSIKQVNERTTDAKWWQYLTWPFGSGQLKIGMEICSYNFVTHYITVEVIVILITNMAAKGNSCFWLANVKKIFSSEIAWPNGAKLGRKHLCKILY
jgi:hypothetical protein